MPKRKHYSVVNNKGFLQRFEAINDAAAKEICKVQGWKPIPTRKPKAKNNEMRTDDYNNSYKGEDE